MRWNSPAAARPIPVAAPVMAPIADDDEEVEEAYVEEEVEEEDAVLEFHPDRQARSQRYLSHT